MEESTIEQSLKENFRKNKLIGSFEIANYFINKFHIITIGGKHDRELFIYQDGIYVTGENKIWRKIQEILDELATTHNRQEIINHIKAKTIVERQHILISENFINLNNGIFDIAKKQLIPHSPEVFFFSKIPTDYNPETDCPAIKKFLSEILKESDVNIIQEWLGYALYRRYFIKKAIVLVGEPDTGKTTLLRLFERFLGKDNISGVSLQKIASDKFSAAQFYNKHLNIFDDLASRDVNDNGMFKIATGGGSITGEYKYGDQFQFENFSKLTFACNKIPDVKDTNDPAYFNRWIIIHFENEIKNPDKFLIDKLSVSEELSGLLNFALMGLFRLLEVQDFSYRKESHEIKTEMERSMSVIAQFAQDCLEESIGDWVDKQTMHEAFAKYARDRRLKVETIEKFGRKLKNYATFLLDSQSGPTRVRGWRNVKIKDLPEFEEVEEVIENGEEEIKVEELF